MLQVEARTLPQVEALALLHVEARTLLQVEGIGRGPRTALSHIAVWGLCSGVIFTLAFATFVVGDPPGVRKGLGASDVGRTNALGVSPCLSHPLLWR